jgi:nitrogen fixation NifU-like protein
MAGDNHVNENLARLYRDAIRHHAAEPTGYRQAIETTHRHEEYNPLCGDRIEVQLRVAAGTIEAAAFDGEACAICLASASMLCSLAPGQTIEALLRLGQDLHRVLDPSAGADSVGAASAAMVLDESQRKESRLKPLPQNPLLREELRPLLGVRPYPSRIRCATLPWIAAAQALAE